MERLPVYIMAGGRCRRFGSDKARAELDCRALIVRVADMLDWCASRICVVADEPGKYADLGLQTIEDDGEKYRGPVAGLATALGDLRDGENWVLAASCDLLVIERSWVESLLASCNGMVRAAAYRDDKWQPYPGVYHRSVRADANALLDTGKASMQRLLDSVRAEALGEPANWPMVLGANQPCDLEAYNRGR